MKFFIEALCWEYYSRPKNSVVIQFITYINFVFKNWEKKLEKYQNLEVFSNFNTLYLLTKIWYPIRIFYTSPMLGILQQTEEFNIIHFKDHDFEFES